MKQMTLWVKTTVEGRIVYMAHSKELLNNYRPIYADDVKLYDVELKGEISNEDAENSVYPR